MRKSAKRSVVLFIAFSIFILVLISALFPSQAFQETTFSPGTMGDVFDPLENGTELTQCFYSTSPITRLSFRTATYTQELTEGEIEVCVWDSAKERILLNHTIQAQTVQDNAFVFVDVSLEPGTYYLSLCFSAFEDGKPVTVYSVENNTDMVGECTFNGEPYWQQMFLCLTTDQKTIQIPRLAFVLLALSILAVAVLRDGCMLRIMLLSGLLCASAAGITAHLAPDSGNCRWYVMPLCGTFLFGGLVFYVQKEIGILQALCRAHTWLRNRRRTLLKTLAVAAGALAVGAGIEWIASCFVGGGVLPARWMFIASVLFVLGYHILFWKQIRKDLPRSFLVVALAAGLVMCVFQPMETGVSWDDQIHYQRTVFLAAGSPAVVSQTDVALADLEIPFSFSMQDVRQTRSTMENGLAAGMLRHQRSAWNILMIGYLPFVIGRWIGQILSLPFWCVSILSRATNLVFYVLVLCLAMRRLKSGRLTVYVLGMLPTGLFLAATYSYDAWVNCLTILGFSYFIGAMQRKDEPLTAREKWIMLSALVIGCIPKAIYTLMIPLLLLMPQDKFSTKQEHRRYLRVVLIATAIGIMIYAVPFLMRGAFTSSTDSRGGAGVNAVGQVKYILLHPVQYAGTLLKFLWSYLSPENSYEYISKFAYLGGKDMHTLTFAVMIAASLTDRGPCDLGYRNRQVMLGSAAWLFVTICAVASALYVTFTPVGLDTVNGCQPRYLIPLLFPALLLVGNIQVNPCPEQKLTKYLISALSAYIAFSCIWETIISRYTV